MRRKTRQIRVGDLSLGGASAVRLQTMWKAPIREIEPVVRSIGILHSFGAELIRFAVPDEDSADLLESVTRASPIPVVADIHFDASLALRCLDFVHKLRLNPGNIRSASKKREVLSKAKDRGVPIRIGINGGSLPHDLRHTDDTATAMVAAAERELDFFASHRFDQVVVSLKSSDMESTVRANRLFSERFDFPLHIGLTEAGPPVQGVVKSSIALAQLLNDGIGDTIRVSLSGPCDDEVIAGREILRVTGHHPGGANIISCPKCGRAGFDVHGFLTEHRSWLASIDAPITIAVMGCEVNGPEEARHADVGIAGSGGKAVVFRSGTIIARVPEAEGARVLKEQVADLCKSR